MSQNKVARSGVLNNRAKVATIRSTDFGFRSSHSEAFWIRSSECTSRISLLKFLWRAAISWKVQPETVGQTGALRHYGAFEIAVKNLLSDFAPKFELWFLQIPTGCDGMANRQGSTCTCMRWRLSGSKYSKGARIWTMAVLKFSTEIRPWGFVGGSSTIKRTYRTKIARISEQPPIAPTLTWRAN